MRFPDNNNPASFGNDCAQGQLHACDRLSSNLGTTTLTDVIEVLQNERSQVL